MNLTEIFSLLATDEKLSSLIPSAKSSFRRPRANPFLIISDKYHKENLHSEVIAYLLDPKADHNCGVAFLYLFIEFLELKRHSENYRKPELKPLRIEDFTCPIVSNEEGVAGGRMDVCIKGMSVDGKWNAIIIENKINNAVDTARQLPTYYNDLVEKQNCNVVRIVYLSLDGYKQPSTIDWKGEELEQILPIIEIIGAFQSEQFDLVNGWLKKCITITQDPDILSFITHYIELIKFKRGDIMNEEHLGKLLDFLKVETNRQQVDYLMTLYNNIGEIMAKRFVSQWNSGRKYPTPFLICTVSNNKMVVLSSFNHKGCNIVFTIVYPLDWNKKRIQFRIFNFASNKSLPPEIIDVANLFHFIPTTHYDNDFEFYLSAEESTPSNEDGITKRLEEIQFELYKSSTGEYNQEQSI